MKTLKKIFTLLLLTTITFGCGGDDDNTPTPTNEFAIQGTDYATPNAYIIMEPNPNPENAFFLYFSNGSLILDTTVNPEILMSTNTSQLISLLVHHGGANVSGQQSINLSSGQTYTLNNQNSGAGINIGGFTDIATINGSQYGELDELQSTIYKIENSGSGSVTVNTFTINYVTNTGTIDCTYTMTDDNGVLISGSYSGNFNLISNFF
jgi:hypothetical protein